VLAALVVFAAFNSVLSLAYYAPLVNAVYRKQASQAVDQGGRMPRSMALPLLLLMAGIVVIGVWPASLDWLTAPAGHAVAALFGG
jgi:multicomponent Na+:H+ antiporter subunit D